MKTKYFFTFLILLIFILSIEAQHLLDVESDVIIRAIEPSIDFYSNTDGRVEGSLDANNDRMYLSSYYDDLRFRTSTTGIPEVRVTIDGATGNVGIGNANPQEVLHVDGNIRIDGLGTRKFTFFKGGGETSYIRQLSSGLLQFVNSSLPGKTQFFTNDGNTMALELDEFGVARSPFGRIGGNGDGYAWKFGVTGPSIYRGAHVVADGRSEIDQVNTSIANADNGLLFWDAGTSTSKWRIMHTGTYFSFVLDNIRQSYIETDGDYVVTSDRRLKKDIVKLDNVLENITQLEPVTYSYKSKANGKTHIGLIAQDVNELFPQAVSLGEDDYYGVAYDQIGVLAIQAVKEQQVIINDLKAQLDIIKSQLDALTKD